LSYPLAVINGYPSGNFRPNTFGSQTITFRYEGVSTPYMTVVDVRPAAIPERVSIVSGNEQTANQQSLLPLPLKVVVVDASNNPIPGVDVTFRSRISYESFGASS